MIALQNCTPIRALPYRPRYTLTQLSNDPGNRRCQTINHCCQWGAGGCSLNVSEVQGRLRAAPRCYSSAHLETWSEVIDSIRQ